MTVLLKPGGVITMEFPHLLRLMQEKPVRHHLPRALLATSPSSSVERVFARARLRRCSTSRSCRPTAARCASTRDTRRRRRQPRRPRSWRCASASERRGPGRAGYLPGIRRAGARDQARPARVPDRRKAKPASASSATAPRPRATRCSTTAASARDLLDYTVDRSPHKQGRFLPGTHIPIYAPERIARDAARLRADPALEPEGRDRGADGGHPRLGRALRGADSRDAGARSELHGDACSPARTLVELEPLGGRARLLRSHLLPRRVPQARPRSR